jgi:hypothetical protein
VPAAGAEIIEPEDAGWVEVYTGKGVQLRQVEAQLQRAGIDVVRLQSAEALPYPVITHQPETAYYALRVPIDQVKAYHEEIEAAVSAATGEPTPDLEAMAEAEEDYDVRACSRCLLFLHHTYTLCPGCGSALVPAVECFGPEQMEPDRVIVRDGAEAEMKALALRLEAAGFDGEAFAVEDWPVAVVDLPWSQLTARTAEAEALLAGEPATGGTG